MKTPLTAGVCCGDATGEGVGSGRPCRAGSGAGAGGLVAAGARGLAGSGAGGSVGASAATGDHTCVHSEHRTLRPAMAPADAMAYCALTVWTFDEHHVQPW